MANKQHLAWLLEGVEKWNTKRQTQEFHPELSGANLAGVHLIFADLRGVDLRQADLRGARLPDAVLEGAVLREANLDSADLSRSNLKGADLQGANLSNVNLTEAILRGTNLQGATLFNAVLREAVLNSAKLQRANFQGGNLQGADLRGAKLADASLVSANLIRAKLQRADLRGANLGLAVLIRANLQHANLNEARLPETDQRRADLQGAYLREANLTAADLRDANLREADLRGAILEIANLEGAILERAEIDLELLAKAHQLPASAIGLFFPNQASLLNASQFKDSSFEMVLRMAKNQNPDSVTAQISFDPEHCEAGKAVLGYFAQILEQKYPEKPVRVTISQERTEVKLTIIGTDDLPVEQISVDLGNYLQVVTGDIPPEQLLENRIHIDRLQSKLELLAVEVRNMERSLETEKRHGLEMRQALERQLKQSESENVGLRRLVGSLTRAQIKVSGKAVDGLANTAETLAASTDRSIHHLGELATRLREDARDASEADRKALELIAALVEKIVRDTEYQPTEAERQEAEQIIPSASPSVQQQISRRLEEASQGVVTGVAGNATFQWLLGLLDKLPG